MRPLRPEEEWARQMVQRTLGLPVHQHDDNSAPAMHDLNIALGDGSTAAVEVTAAADGESIALWNLVNGQDERWQVPGIEGGWFVELDPRARAKTLRRELPELLAQLEREGVRFLEASRRRRPGATSHEEVAARLGVRRAHQSATHYPGSIYATIDIPSERSGDMVPTTGDPLGIWLAEFLAAPEQADVRAKLAHAGTAERHAFVLVPGFSPAPFAVVHSLMRDGAPLPTARPILPREITHVWAASTWSSGHGVRWSPDIGWSAFSKETDGQSRVSA